MNRYFFLFIFLFISISSQAQRRTLLTDRAIIRGKLQLAGMQIDSISTDSNFVNPSHQKLPTQKAVEQRIQLHRERSRHIEFYGAGLDDGIDDSATLGNLSGNQTILVNGQLDINADVTLGASLDFSEGGSLHLADNVTVTIAVPFIPAENIFQGNALVKLDVGLEAINVKWFGATGDGMTDDADAIQRAIDACLYGNRMNKLIYLPAGDYRITKPLHLGYGNAFRTISLVGAGVAYRSEASFGGTTIIADFAQGMAVNIQGLRNATIKDLSITGQNAIENPTGWAMQDPANWIDPTLPADANSQFAPYSAITVDAYAGSRPAISYPNVAYPFYAENGNQYNKYFTSVVTIENVYIDRFINGVSVQPCNADGNGDFVRIDKVGIERCLNAISIGNSQSRNLNVSNSQLRAHTNITTSDHGKQVGRVDLVQNVHFTGYQAFRITNTAVSGPLLVESSYGEVLGRIGQIGSNSSNNGSVYFVSCHWQFDGFNNHYMIDMIDIDHKASTYFQGNLFTGMKWYTVDNTSNAHVAFVDCNFFGRPASCEPASEDVEDEAHEYFYKYNAFVWGKNPETISIERSKRSSSPSYSGQTEPFGKGTNLIFSHPQYLTHWDDDLKYLDDNTAHQISLKYHGRIRYFQPAGQSAVLNQRVLTFNLPEANNYGYGIGTTYTSPDGSIFLVDSIDGTAMWAKLMNNYLADSNGDFVSYTNGTPNLSLTGKLYSPNKLVMPRNIIGDFTQGSDQVTNLRYADTGAAASDFIRPSTPLFYLNDVVRDQDEYLSSDCYILSASGTSLTLKTNARLTGTFPLMTAWATGKEILYYLISLVN